jgi:hypothetical protein
MIPAAKKALAPQGTYIMDTNCCIKGRNACGGAHPHVIQLECTNFAKQRTQMTILHIHTATAQVKAQVNILMARI